MRSHWQKIESEFESQAILSEQDCRPKQKPFMMFPK